MFLFWGLRTEGKVAPASCLIPWFCSLAVRGQPQSSVFRWGLSRPHCTPGPPWLSLGLAEASLPAGCASNLKPFSLSGPVSFSVKWSGLNRLGILESVPHWYYLWCCLQYWFPNVPSLAGAEDGAFSGFPCASDTTSAGALVGGPPVRWPLRWLFPQRCPLCFSLLNSCRSQVVSGREDAMSYSEARHPWVIYFGEVLVRDEFQTLSGLAHNLGCERE